MARQYLQSTATEHRELIAMRRWWMTAVITLAAACGVSAGPETMSVQVRVGQVRASASYLGAVVAELPYGTAVQVDAASKPWMRVRLADGRTGWMHESALVRGRLQMKGGSDVQAGASVGEVALAAKGFTQQVEKEFRRQNPTLSFEWVDRMESYRVTPAEAQAFLRTGRLTPAAEASRP
ncbi:MAG: SH3 domain-containing protein [Kiritimatiellae bacterium]|nr:SH3 domain-containing protein [Kiritimatiellia bacterium]